MWRKTPSGGCARGLLLKVCISSVTFAKHEEACLVHRGATCMFPPNNGTNCMFDQGDAVLHGSIRLFSSFVVLTPCVLVSQMISSTW